MKNNIILYYFSLETLDTMLTYRVILSPINSHSSLVPVNASKQTIQGEIGERERVGVADVSLNVGFDAPGKCARKMKG